MSKPDIVEACLSDAAIVARAEREYIDCPWTEEQVKSEMSRPDVIFLVARLNGEFCGYLSGVCAADECEISNIAVEMPFRRRGVAKSLFDAFISRAAARGVKHMYLLVAEDNIAARALYRKLCFAEAGVRRGYYAGRDGISMRLDL